MSGLPVIRMRYRAHAARDSFAAYAYLPLPILAAIVFAAHIFGLAQGMAPRERTHPTPGVAFVRLTPEQSEAAMARVRTSWQLERGGPVSVDFDSAAAAFVQAMRPAGPVSLRRPKVPPSYGANMAELSGSHPLAPPSVAAPPPEELADVCAPTPVDELFPRNELLKFDGLSPFKKGTK